MPAILRIGVDRTYENRILHYMRVNQELFLGIDLFGYLGPCKKLVDDLNERGIKASLFFQPFTVPNKDFAQELMKHGHSVGLHAVHTKDYNDFSRDLGKVSRRFDGKVYGFTKHDFKIDDRWRKYLYRPATKIIIKNENGTSYKMRDGYNGS